MLLSSPSNTCSQIHDFVCGWQSVREACSHVETPSPFDSTEKWKKKNKNGLQLR